MPNPAEPRFPTHVAIIVDGNRRWAKQRLLPVSMGHKAGFDRLREITRYAVGDRGVFVLSLYVFSTENFSRDAKEVGYLMDLFANNFRTIADEMNERGCKVLFSGRREGLQQRVLDAMDYMMDPDKGQRKGYRQLLPELRQPCRADRCHPRDCRRGQGWCAAARGDR